MEKGPKFRREEARKASEAYLEKTEKELPKGDDLDILEEDPEIPIDVELPEELKQEEQKRASEEYLRKRENITLEDIEEKQEKIREEIEAEEEHKKAA